MQDAIEVLGARVHNLKDMDIAIPKNRLVVVTGISGSGKSSLAFDTLFAEGQRRYMETFGAYARQFIGDMDRPDVDRITGLSPVISIEQKTTNRNPRSTVGTVTEIYDFLRLLFARVGEAFSYHTGRRMEKFSEDEILDDLFRKFDGRRIQLLAPLVRGRKGHYRELFEDVRKKGYLKVRVDGEVKDLVPKMQVDRYRMHDIELVVDRLQVAPDMRVRLAQSLQKAMQLGKDLVFVLPADHAAPVQYSKQLMCVETGLSYEEPSPNTFSFNSPYGACPQCKGLGQIYRVDLEAVMPDRSLSIEAGGIAPLGEAREAQVYRLVEQLAKKNRFSVKTPLSDLSDKHLNLVLYGSETEPDAEELMAGSDEPVPEGAYEGIVRMVIRWFNDSHSDAIREWAERFMQLDTCPTCAGTRLKKESLWFKIAGRNIAELGDMDLDRFAAWVGDLEGQLSAKQRTIARDLLKEIAERTGFLLDMGLDYLTLNRPTRTLSGGESQRIRLATQIGSQLQGITYILDEPSIGLHQRDNHRLITALQHLRDIGNTVIVVEHDRDIMLAADHLIDIGPGAGQHGGRVVAQGTPAEVLRSDASETARYLDGRARIELPAGRRPGNGRHVVLQGASGHNLRDVDVSIPLGTLTVVTGVSGSGKSTLVNETLYPILARHCHGARLQPMPYRSVSGLEDIDKVIEIDQSPIGRTPRSNPATYCGFFNEIRQLFAAVPEAKVRGYTPGRFSFNVKQGRCEVCEGGGMRVIEMNFLPDVYVPCEKCSGRRYNRETLEIRYKGKSISDVLDMTVDEACEFFMPVPYLYRKMHVLQQVGLGYVTLGQSAVTLSGGEAQRVKLATELAKRDTGRTFYILDEPTTGLHFQDIRHLLDVLQKLVDRGNTVLVIEHNMDVIKVADHILDMGPEGGRGGGTLLYAGPPEGLPKVRTSHTGRYLRDELER
jgi:excinuclease ABC subunit A